MMSTPLPVLPAPPSEPTLAEDSWYLTLTPGGGCVLSWALLMLLVGGSVQSLGCTTETSRPHDGRLQENTFLHSVTLKALLSQ